MRGITTVEMIAVLTTDHAEDMQDFLVTGALNKNSPMTAFREALSLLTVIQDTKSRKDMMDPEKVLLTTVFQCSPATPIQALPVTFLTKGEVIILKAASEAGDSTHCTFTRDSDGIQITIKELSPSENPLLNIKLLYAIDASQELSEICLHVSATIYDKIERRGMQRLKVALENPKCTLEQALLDVTDELRKAIEFYEN